MAYSASKTANSRSLADVDECSSPEGNSCDANAMCTNTEGSYVCRCLKGFTGDGKSCSGKVRQSLTIIKTISALRLNHPSRKRSIRVEGFSFGARIYMQNLRSVILFSLLY